MMILVMACEALAGSQVTFCGALGDLDRAECKRFRDRTPAAPPAIAPIGAGGSSHRWVPPRESSSLSIKFP
ncbi:hypothetical protein [Phormidium sp. CCY1219]|uniref:hypothetical protein n=1 Tax=Phormidium sp. CCY1219 TaxID=2886104 RepID=UPI002D1EFEC1|nr:hypothetical protein [Phormidium sp. CCY1219]MEB3829071.1 hypothetical protein [Phormidium sp. CCY1219]